MKTLLILSTTAVLSGLTWNAQAQQVRFGVKAGANYSRLSLSNVPQENRIVGITAGFLAYVPITQDGSFGVQPELLYSAKGSKFTSGSTSYTRRLHYLDVPVLAKINAGGFAFEVGPQASVLLAGRSESPFGTSTDISSLNRASLGAVAGIGYQLPMGLGLTLRYAHDITRVVARGERNSLFQLQLSYLFGSK